MTGDKEVVTGKRCEAIQTIALHLFYDTDVEYGCKRENLPVTKENGMELAAYFRSVMEQDRCAVVICNPVHEIIYMNPAAVRAYDKRGGAKLLGKSLLDCHGPQSVERIRKVVAWFRQSSEHNRVYTFHNEKENKDVYMVALRDENDVLIGYYEKHEYRNRETAALYDLE